MKSVAEFEFPGGVEAGEVGGGGGRCEKVVNEKVARQGRTGFRGFLNERAAEQLKQDSNKLETPEGTATQEEPDALEPTA